LYGYETELVLSMQGLIEVPEFYPWLDTNEELCRIHGKDVCEPGSIDLKAPAIHAGAWI
jgi:hypothetical protein